MLGVQLLVMGICGVIALIIAKNKGRSPVGWFFGGFFLGIIGIVIVAVLSNKKKEKAKWARERSKRRRLREELRQERMKSETTRQHANQRLDAHDELLGVNTRTETALEGAAASQKQLTENPPPPPEKEWFFVKNNERQGPVSEDKIRGMLGYGQLSGDSLVWRDGLEEWRKAKNVAEFESEIAT